MKLSKRAEETLFRIMQDIDKLERHGVEVSGLTIDFQLATHEEEKKIAEILGLETTDHPGASGSYILETSARSDK